MQAWKIEQNHLTLSPLTLSNKKSNVIIEVKALGINRADLMQIQGIYPAPDGSVVPGLEVSGIIAGTGQKVCALLPSGGYATHVCVDRRLVIPIPNGLTFEEAAALPEALLTCYLNLFTLAKLKKGQAVLVHGATSGIGSFAIACANAVGAKVYATTGRDTPDYLNYNGDWSQIKVDVVLDMLGGAFVSRNISALNPKGKYVSIAVMQGTKGEINMASVLMKNLTIIGSTLRSKTATQKAQLLKKAHAFITEHPIKPKIDSVFAFHDLPNALKRLEDRTHIGKVVVKI
ncbi:MAG: zinc-binding dehydrogenase [Rickettsiales bacterium]